MSLPTVVAQLASNFSASAVSSISATFPSSVQAGSSILVLGVFDNGVAIDKFNNITDTSGNNYSQISNLRGTTLNPSGTPYYMVQNSDRVVSGSNTVTVNYTTAVTNAGIIILEIANTVGVYSISQISGVTYNYSAIYTFPGTATDAIKSVNTGAYFVNSGPYLMIGFNFCGQTPPANVVSGTGGTTIISAASTVFSTNMSMVVESQQIGPESNGSSTFTDPVNGSTGHYYTLGIPYSYLPSVPLMSQVCL